MFSAPTNQDTSLRDAITNAMDVALVTHARAEYAQGRGSGVGDVAKKRIGAGYIGVECDRALAFKYHKVPKEDREGPVSAAELQRHAEAGFWTEDKTAEWLRLAGFELLTHKEDGRQYGFMDAKDPVTGQYRLAGEVDGVILKAPPGVDLPVPCIWESKKATAKKFATFEKSGVKGADKKYYGQLQTNMGYMEIGHVLFSMLNLDTMQYYHELITFDQPEAQRLTDRAVRVFTSECAEEFARLTKDRSDFRCRFCDYQKHCWDTPVKTAPVEVTPFWLTPGDLDNPREPNENLPFQKP
jgi:hypothetical protein